MAHGSPQLDCYLAALGDELAEAEAPIGILVVGGAALLLAGETDRLTSDVDVLAEVRGGALAFPRPFTPALDEAIRRVAANFPGHLEPEWVNAAVAKDWEGKRWPDALPPGLNEVVWRQYGPLAVGLAGRRTLIPMKIHALVDRSTEPTFDAQLNVTGALVRPTGYDKRHLTDVLALKPTDSDLAEAAAWVRTQDSGDIGPLVDAVIDRIRAER